MPPSPITRPRNSARSTPFFGLRIGFAWSSGLISNLLFVSHQFCHLCLRCFSSTGMRPYFAMTARAPFWPAARVWAYLSRMKNPLGRGICICLQRACTQESCIGNFSFLQSRIERSEHPQMRAISLTEDLFSTPFRNIFCLLVGNMAHLSFNDSVIPPCYHICGGRNKRRLCTGSRSREGKECDLR